MKKLIITEEEKQRIRTLHEQTWFKDNIVNPIKSFFNKDQGVENPEETAPETEKKDMASYEKLVNEPVKQENGKDIAWGMGKSPDQSTAYKMATQQARAKINKNNVSEVDTVAFKDNNGSFIYFVKMST